MQLTLITLVWWKKAAYVRLGGEQQPTEGTRRVRVLRSRTERPVVFVRVQRALL